MPKTKRRLKPKIGDILEIEWIDVQTVDGHGVSVDDVLEVEPMLCKSVGKYIGDNEHYMVLIHNEFNSDAGSPDYILIVHGCIRSIEVLKKGKA
jgi:hypothetical protein